VGDVSFGDELIVLLREGLSVHVHGLDLELVRCLIVACRALRDDLDLKEGVARDRAALVDRELE